MGKRKAEQLDSNVDAGTSRRSSRRIAIAGSLVANPTPVPTPAKTASSTKTDVKAAKKPIVKNGAPKESARKSEAKNTKPTKSAKVPEARPTAPKKKAASKAGPSSNGAPTAAAKVTGKPSAEAATPATTGGKQYWLLKAEPESRLENGIDVKFSIDDLATKTAPEPWDGIRAYPARNNLRAMKKGDLAFFYHSNCKEPGIAGIMEIVQEHSPDLSAHNPKAPYYDPKSKPDDPRWSVVHVAFRRKFAVPVGLREMRELQKQAGSPLEDMQMLRMGRLSVSRVSEGEWAFLLGLAEEKERAAKEESG